MLRTSQFALAVSCAFLLAAQALAETNPVFDTLTKRGVAMPKGPVLKLPAPTMPDGLDAAGQRKALQSIADQRRPVEALLKKSVTAPPIIKTGDDPASAAAGGTGKRVDFYFVVYGDLKKIADEGFWGDKKDNAAEDQVNPNDAQFSGKLLTAEELKARKIEPLISADVVENYGNADVQLFNRVRVRGTSRSIQTKTDESVTYATILDPRFARDDKFPNQWQSVVRDDAGKLTYGPLQQYAGLGAYAKATTLKEPEGAIFLEYHMIYDEPQGWFSGANLIRTKLPAIVQDNVKKLRRKLAEKEES